MGRDFFPLDEELGLLPGTLTPSLAEDAALLGSLVPFVPAAELIGHFRKVEVSEATVLQVSESSGQAWVELQREEVEALELELKEAPEGLALQQLSVDGATVPLLHGEWAEVKTLVVGTIEDPGLTGEVHAQDLSYFSWMLDQQSFGRLATVETHRRGAEGDGMCGGGRSRVAAEVHRPALPGRGPDSGMVSRAGILVQGGTSRFWGWNWGSQRVVGNTVAPVETWRAGRSAPQPQGAVPGVGGRRREG